MKKFSSFVLAIVVIFSMAVVGTPDNVGAGTNKIEVTKVSVTKSDIKVKIGITANCKQEVFWGNEFGLERYENGAWQKLAMREGVSWNSIAFCLASSDKAKVITGYHTYVLNSLYEKEDLFPGKYRICMSINFKKSDRYAEFVIPEYQEVNLIKNTTVKVSKGTLIKIKLRTKKEVKWTTNNEKIATVSKKGVVTTKKAGKVTIKAKCGNKVLK